MTIFNTTVLSLTDIDANSSIRDVIKKRCNIFEMTQAAEDAVIRPKNFGSLPHELRAWLAARIAKKAGHSELASRYMQSAGLKASSDHPGNINDFDLGPVIAFVDKVANTPRDFKESDLADLQVAGFKDQDIVKLCQLVAFVAYQVRIVAGIQMMNNGAI